MIRRRTGSARLLFVLCASLVAACSLAATGGDTRAAEARNCERARSTTLLRNDEARIYRRGSDGATFGCAFRGELWQLDDPRGATSYAFRPPAMFQVGPIVAYAVHQEIGALDPFQTEIIVQDLRERTEDSSILRQRTADSRGVVKIGSLVARRNAAVAWITCPERGQPYGERSPNCIRAGSLNRVYKLDSTARDIELLDQGRRINPSSLRVRGSTIAWTNRGKRIRTKLH